MQYQPLNPYFIKAELDYRRGLVRRLPARRGGTARRFRVGRRHGADR